MTLRNYILCIFCLTVGTLSIAAPQETDCTSLHIKDSCKPVRQGNSATHRLKLGGEQTIKTTITVPQHVADATQCEAHVSISYLQMYDKIRVDTTVVNDDCNTSSGAYKIRARTHGPDGAVDTREFIEQWQRDVAAEIEQTHVYEMSGDATLLWMKVGTSRSTACNCVVPSEPEFP